MTTFLKNLILTCLISGALIIVAFNIPAEKLNLQTWRGQTLGALALTDISASTAVSAYPAIQNANNALIETAINTIEGTTTNSTITTLSGLTTIGTITTGVWNGTAIDVAHGGTGATSLTQYNVLLGSSTNPVFPLGGVGVSGQFLTSQGPGKVPQWTTSALDLAGNYTWTGHHIFSSLFATQASTTNATTTNLTITGNLIFSGTNSTGIAKTASTTTYLSSSTYTLPTNGKKVFVQLWGAGGSGANHTTAGAGGGGGGEYSEWWFDSSSITGTLTVTIGTGGVARSGASSQNGADGGSTYFGGYATSTGGKGGIQNSPTNDGTGGDCGYPYVSVNGIWGAGVAEAVGQSGKYCGAGGGATQTTPDFTGGSSYYGGAGGAGATNEGTGSEPGGYSTYGGNGGYAAEFNGGNSGNGSVPGGGGGAHSGTTGNSGAGGDGKAIITTFF